MRVDIERADGTKIAIEGDDEPVARIARELAQSPRPASFDPPILQAYPVPFPIVLPALLGSYVPPFGQPVIYCDQNDNPFGGLN